MCVVSFLCVAEEHFIVRTYRSLAIGLPVSLSEGSKVVGAGRDRVTQGQSGVIERRARFRDVC